MNSRIIVETAKPTNHLAVKRLAFYKAYFFSKCSSQQFDVKARQCRLCCKPSTSVQYKEIWYIRYSEMFFYRYNSFLLSLELTDPQTSSDNEIRRKHKIASTSKLILTFRRLKREVTWIECFPWPIITKCGKHPCALLCLSRSYFIFTCCSANACTRKGTNFYPWACAYASLHQGLFHGEIRIGVLCACVAS